MRLFTALWPPADVVAALENAVQDALRPRWRRTPTERWHVTLAFHGEDDPDARSRELDRRLTGARAPRLRVAGAGTFPGVLWAGIETADDDEGLRALVVGAGGDPDAFVAHLTLARSRHRSRGRPRPPILAPGRWWTPAEVLLVAVERADGELRYRPVHRVPLGS